MQLHTDIIQLKMIGRVCVPMVCVCVSVCRFGKVSVPFISMLALSIRRTYLTTPIHRVRMSVSGKMQMAPVVIVRTQ